MTEEKKTGAADGRLDEFRRKIRMANIPRVSIGEMKEALKRPDAEEFLDSIYRPFLSQIGASSLNDINLLRRAIDEYCVEMSQETVRNLTRRIMSGEIRIESIEDMQKLPYYRHHNPDGSVMVINIPEQAQPYYALCTWLNETAWKMGAAEGAADAYPEYYR